MARLIDRINKFDRLMAAITFAEADEREKALEVLSQKPKKKKHKWIGSRIKREKTQPDLRI
jgi:hypothetical protein